MFSVIIGFLWNNIIIKEWRKFGDVGLSRARLTSAFIKYYIFAHIMIYISIVWKSACLVSCERFTRKLIFPKELNQREILY